MEAWLVVYALVTPPEWLGVVPGWQSLALSVAFDSEYVCSLDAPHLAPGILSHTPLGIEILLASSYFGREPLVKNLGHVYTTYDYAVHRGNPTIIHVAMSFPLKDT